MIASTASGVDYRESIDNGVAGTSIHTLILPKGIIL
jgi:hypothetical protein